MSAKLIRLSELAGRPLSKELIPGLLDDGLILAIAKEGNGKTFFGVHCAAHVASGAKWRGRHVEAGPVVYCIAEGVSFFPFRFTTAFDALGVRASDMPLYILPHSINLRSSDDGEETQELSNLFLEISKLEQNPRLIVFDTLNRYMPGGDENNQKDASAFVRGCEFLQRQFECSVMLMHHLSKAAGVARGSSVLTAAADQVIYCDSDKGELTSKPVKWTTKEKGKRKDRDAVEQWFEYRRVPMSRGNMCDKNEGQDDSEHYVMATDYDENGFEYVTSSVESTLVMVPVEYSDEEAGKAHHDPELDTIKALIAESQTGIGVRNLMRATGWANKKVYRLLDTLVDDKAIYLNSEKHYKIRTGNPLVDV